MKQLLFAATLVLGFGPALAAEAPCGNTAYNVVRALECEAYTTDWSQHKDLRDKRLEAMTEWSDAHPESALMLDILLKEGMLRRSHALARDTQIFGKDADMWKLRSCGDLPLCVNDRPKPGDKPAAKPRNRRTGGNYCGPRDRRRGYCS